MIELLDPAPGQRILDLAAGPGETGFEVLPLIQPGGELLSTDAAPEMVEVARRRAATLGLEGDRVRGRGRCRPDAARCVR